MLVTKKYVGDIFLHVGDISIGHQNHNMRECDVGDRYVMLEAWNSIKFLPPLNSSRGTYIGRQHHNTPECDVGDWYLMLVPNDVSNIRHQHWCYPTSWRVLNEVEKSNERLRWESLSTSLRIFQLHIGLTGPRLICNVFTHSSLNATWNDYLTDL